MKCEWNGAFVSHGGSRVVIREAPGPKNYRPKFRAPWRFNSWPIPILYVYISILLYKNVKYIFKKIRFFSIYIYVFICIYICIYIYIIIYMYIYIYIWLYMYVQENGISSLFDQSIRSNQSRSQLRSNQIHESLNEWMNESINQSPNQSFTHSILTQLVMLLIPAKDWKVTPGWKSHSPIVTVYYWDDYPPIHSPGANENPDATVPMVVKSLS